jgi:hypothetical protein
MRLCRRNEDLIGWLCRLQSQDTFSMRVRLDTLPTRVALGEGETSARLRI